MGWVLRLVETGADGSSRSVDVMAIDHPGDLGDIAVGREVALVQQEIVTAQSRDHAVRRSLCRSCGAACQVKDYRPHQIATLFGQVTLRLWRRVGPRDTATGPACGGRSATALPGNPGSSGNGRLDGAVRIRPHGPDDPAAKAQPPTARKAVRLLMGEPDKLDEGDRRFVKALLDLSPPIAQAVELSKAFSTMIKNGLADQLDCWISAAETGGFKGFARSLH